MGAPSKQALTLDPQPWMTASETQAVMAALSADGATVRFVGGCVRDALMQRPVNEVDLATPERPERVIELLENAGIRVIPTGIEHGTVTAITDNKNYHITSLRKDIATDGRRAVIQFTDDWKEDAARRDFTFNALSASPDGLVYDYFDGLKDLSDRRIKFVGCAEERIKEDHLRILRYFRFIAVLGVRNDDQPSHQLCISKAHLISNLSGERIRDELFKILKSEIKNDALALMINNGVTQHFLPEAVNPDLLNQLMLLENFAAQSYSVSVDPIRRLASLIETDEKGADGIAERLKFSKSHRKKLKKLIKTRFKEILNLNEDKLRAIIYQNGSSHIIDLSLLQWSQMLIDMPRLPQEQKDAWLRIIEMADGWMEPIFPVRGQDLVNLGIEEGPKISSLLNQLEDWWAEGGCHPDRAACLKKLKNLMETG